ncbi:MAG: DinB family protein [Gemmatimonadota bacterium]|nr:DinB family protein [Gemmatimonadota bacterium]
MPAPETQLRESVSSATPRLVAITDAAAALPRAPGKWSRKEIIGHLIDSASNNHERFVRSQFTDDLICPTYDQDEWVRVQRYYNAPWIELVTLWSHFNTQLARVIEATPMEIRSRPRARHNLDRVAFRSLPAGEPATLEYFMHDYVVHLEHHLAQILG